MACISAQGLVGVVLMLSMGATLSTKVNIEDLCDTQCKFQDRVVHYSKIVPGFTPRFNFSVTARSTEALNPGWRYSIKAHLLGVLMWQSSGAACGETLIGDNVALIVTIGFPSCDAEPGDVTVPVSVIIHLPLKATPIYANVSIDIADGLGALAAKFLMRIGGWKGDEVDNTTGIPVSSRTKPSPLFWPGTHVEPRDLCDSTCLLQDRVLNFPDHYFGPTFKFNVQGRLPQQLPLIRFGLHAVMHVLGKLPVSILLGNGTACGKTTTGDGVMFGLELDFPSCPVAQGVVSVDGHARFTLPIDVAGRIALTIDVTDSDSGTLVASVLVELHFGIHSSSLVAGGDGEALLV